MTVYANPNRWNDSDRQAALLTAVEDEFMKAGLRKGYRIADRSDVDRVLQEIHFQQSGLTDEAGAARLGKMLNVEVVLLIKVIPSKAIYHSEGPFGANHYYNATCNVSARLISVERAEVLALASVSHSGIAADPDDFQDLATQDATELAGALPGKY